MPNDYEVVTTCRVCDYDQLELVIDLGNQPLANSYRDSLDEVLPTYPLALNACPHCTHMQLSVVVNPDLMFKNYLYVSGTTKTFRDYFKYFAGAVIETYKQRVNYMFSPRNVLDIACNDQTLLDEFKALGLDTYGVDPAENLAVDKGHKVVVDYLKDSTFPDHQFDIITAQNVIAHVGDPLGFLKNCKRLLRPEGILAIQTSQANMIENGEYDVHYHEHVSYFTPNSIRHLAERAGLEAFAYRKTSVHGVSNVFYFTKPQGLEDAVNKYKETVKTNIKDFRETLLRYGGDHLLVGYGAAAKGMVVLGATRVDLDYIIDDNPLKQGKFAPVGNIPIVSIEKLREESPDTRILFVPLAWNFFDEIRERVKAVRNNPLDRFYRYFPHGVVQS